MKAILVKQPGGPEQMNVGELPPPEPADDELLVRVHACAVNRADVMQRQGMYPPPQGASEVLGLEMAGEVVASGSQCLQYQQGDRVFGLLDGGGYAEYALIPEAMAMPIPENLSYDEAAAIPEVFLTAYQALHWHGRIKPGETVLVHAGASGVGTAAIQLAKRHSCRVIATTRSAGKANACISLGANDVIISDEKDFAEEVLALTEGAGADVIIDFVGAAYLAQNLKCLAMDGRLVLLALMGGYKVEEFNLLSLVSKRATIVASTLRNRDKAYKIKLTEAFSDDCLASFAASRLKPIIDRTMDIRDVAQAHEYMEANQNIGKIVLSGF